MKIKQNMVLFELLKSSPDLPVTKEEIAKTLDIKVASVPVYIHSLKKELHATRSDAEITTVRESKKALGYKLVGGKSLTVKNKRFVKESSNSEPKVVTISETGELPLIDKDNELTSISEREFDDLRSSLGLFDNTSYNKYSE